MAEEWDVFSLAPDGSATAPTYLATLYEAREKSIRPELDGPGSGSFAINRASPECTEAILAQGNLVKVRIPEIDTDYCFAFFLETGDFTLISSDEAGGEMLHFGGRGALSYPEYGCAWSTSYITGGMDPIDGVWRAYAAGTGSAPGQILRRMIEEFQHVDRPQFPIPLLTPDFDYSLDSNGDAWTDPDATDEFSYQVGEDGLAIVLRLIPTGVTVQMDADFTLHAYNTLGRDLTGDAFGTGVVRFERGVNIATELRREQQPNLVATHELVAGETDHFGRAVLDGADTRVTKEVYLAAFGTGATALNALGTADLRERLNQSDTIMFPIANRRTADIVLADPVSIGSPLGPVAATGFYLPGPAGTSGDFWVGDTVRVNTGSGAFDYDEVDARVMAITITRDDDNHELIVIPELKTQPPTPPTSPAFCCLTWPTADSGHLSEPLYWTYSGDTPKAGDVVYPNRVPTSGLLSKIAVSGYPTHYTGVLVGGTGTIDVYAMSDFLTVGSLTGLSATWHIMKNGVSVASASQSYVSGSAWGPAQAVSITGLSVIPGDVIEHWVVMSDSPPRPVTVPSGVGSYIYVLKVTGSLA